MDEAEKNNGGRGELYIIEVDGERRLKVDQKIYSYVFDMLSEEMESDIIKKSGIWMG
jgi:hypothetical protein